MGAFRAAACENLEEMTKTVSESNVDKKKLAKASNDKTLLNCTACSSSLLALTQTERYGRLADAISAAGMAAILACSHRRGIQLPQAQRPSYWHLPMAHWRRPAARHGTERTPWPRRRPQGTG